MNINQIGLYNQGSEKSNKVSNKSSGIGEPVKSSHITVGQSSIQNAIASSCNTYGKTPRADGNGSAKQDVISKTTAEYFNDINSRMTEDDTKDIEDEGMSLEKYNMERLDRTLNRIKKQKQFKEDCMESNAQKRKQRAEDIEKAIEEYKAVCDLFEEDVYTAIDLDECVKKRTVKGGPSPECVINEVKALKKKIAEWA